MCARERQEVSGKPAELVINYVTHANDELRNTNVIFFNTHTPESPELHLCTTRKTVWTVRPDALLSEEDFHLGSDLISNSPSIIHTCGIF